MCVAGQTETPSRLQPRGRRGQEPRPGRAGGGGRTDGRTEGTTTPNMPSSSGRTTTPSMPCGTRRPCGGRRQPWPTGSHRAQAAARRSPPRLPLSAPRCAGVRPLTRVPSALPGPPVCSPLSILSRAELVLNALCAPQIPSPRSCQSNGSNKESLQYEIEELKQKDLALDQEIAQLLSEGYSLEELEKHISLLHEYNDIKDAGQMLLGKLAVIRGVTTKQLYPEYDLDLSD
uniref:DNA repair protein SWI5 homolog n=1 Tax=Amazona collaria TaxID=241587 RepID=A0A8B9G2C0_9PSIT